MDKSQFDRAQQLFLTAVELPAEQRDSWLVEQCGDDIALPAGNRTDSLGTVIRLEAESLRFRSLRARVEQNAGKILCTFSRLVTPR